MQKPQINAKQALDLAQRFFGQAFDGAEALLGYDDANWLLTTASGPMSCFTSSQALPPCQQHGQRSRHCHPAPPTHAHVGNKAVLKVVNSMDSAAPGFCEAQGALLDFLAGQRGLPVPRPLPVLSEAAATAAPTGSGSGSGCGAPRPRFTAYIQGTDPSLIHAVRMLSFLPGELVRSCSEQGPGLYHSIGAFVGRLDQALAAFDAPPLHREHPWNLDCLPATWLTARPALAAASLPPSVDL